MNPAYEAAMARPIGCRGDSCHQGRKPCATPLRCCDFDADDEIAAFRRDYPEQPDEPVTSPEQAGGWTVAALFILIVSFAAFMGWLAYRYL